MASQRRNTCVVIHDQAGADVCFPTPTNMSKVCSAVVAAQRANKPTRISNSTPEKVGGIDVEAPPDMTSDSNLQPCLN